LDRFENAQTISPKKFLEKAGQTCRFATTHRQGVATFWEISFEKRYPILIETMTG